MNKQKNTCRRETEKLLQHIAERQRELCKLSSNLQELIVPQKTNEIKFEWKSKIEDNFELMKLSKAV